MLFSFDRFRKKCYNSFTRESGNKHKLPHIHAEYSGSEIAVALDGTVIEDDL